MTKDSKNPPIPAKRELIVIAHPEAGLRARDESIVSVTGASIAPLANLVSSKEINLRPLFGLSEEQLKFNASSISATTGAAPPDLSVYYRVEAPDIELEPLAEK